ncbi:hypothetical protein PAI11_39210 [Patulibacter medicamentivorans]|uniref:Uncharacterized protein n=1 Tax=Patulibacter medicamentivorans TaxID=1097667 RepID=H0EAP7_9ACTN|nr:DUF1707 domain-containing protein [Patulibacter medicamentivorans]EHN09222.1 hypothetical protein PAI11_39210 [Patulibacter medicamentivorans]
MADEARVPDDEPAPPPAVPAAGSLALRASDRERERAAELLRHAMGEGRLTVDELDERLTSAFGARTRVELERLLADVLVPADGPHPLDVAPSTRSPLPVRPGAQDEHIRIWAVMGGSDRSGRWRVPRRVSVVNVMGGSDLDLSEAELAGHVVEITVVSIMGGSNIRIPEGVNVEVSETSIMGGNDVHQAAAPASPEAPTVRLRLISIMSGNSVRRGRRKRRRRGREIERGDDERRLGS